MNIISAFLEKGNGHYQTDAKRSCRINLEDVSSS